MEPPCPLPSRTVNDRLSWFANARWRIPSWLKSPMATSLGACPAKKGEPRTPVKPPLPSPSRIVTCRFARSLRQGQESHRRSSQQSRHLPGALPVGNLIASLEELEEGLQHEEPQRAVRAVTAIDAIRAILRMGVDVHSCGEWRQSISNEDPSYGPDPCHGGRLGRGSELTVSKCPTQSRTALTTSPSSKGFTSEQFELLTRWILASQCAEQRKSTRR